MQSHWSLLASLFIGTTLVAWNAHAQRDRAQFSPTDAEVMALPDYCQVRLRGSDDMKRAWAQRMGRDQYQHVHHHCFGLNFMNRAAVEFDPKQRRFILQQAVRNFDYVLNRWPAGFPLTVEARNMKMQAEAMLAR